MPLEPLVIDMADKYGIPPQFLMSQVTKEANHTGDPTRYNAYSYRYEAYGFDFIYITGDLNVNQCCDANGHKFLETYHSFLGLGLVGASKQVEMRPVAGFDDVPVRLGVAPQAVGSLPTATFQIPAGTNGPPIEWDVAVTDTTGASQYTRVEPGFVGPLAPTQFSVDCRSGLLTFGLPPADPSHLNVNYRPARNVPNVGQPQGFGDSLAGATSLPEIVTRCPGCDILPPSDPARTISEWAATRSNDGHTLIQTINRYGRNFPPPLNWYLLQEDPSFDVQGQWYGAASFGLLQVWPDNALTTINAMPVARRAELRAVYNPLQDPGTKLFNPSVGVLFGAAADAAVTVRAEGSSVLRTYEPSCAPEPTAPPFNNCTWNRMWARRFSAFNTGQDNRQDGFQKYGWPIVTGSPAFEPALQPVQ